MVDLDRSDWHSIRPWSRRFSLSVREVTSVSATFILASTFDIHDETDPSLASLGLTISDDEEDDTSKQNRVVADTLSKGLSVEVNNLPWQRVFLRVDEEADEALIIVFGLAPGKRYDIELGITPREEHLRSQITTDQLPDHPDSASEESTSLMSNPDGLPSSLSPDSPSSSPSMSASALDTSSNSTSPSTFISEDRAHHTLLMLQSERDSLIGSMKGARRDAQKADASIRSEIDALKRASEKYSSVEHRARQKVLALQEVVKQSLAAASETGALVLETEASFPVLQDQVDEAEMEYKIVKEKADRILEEKAVLEKKEKRRIESMQNELAGLGHKLEKLNGKKDKLETGTIPDLEEELRRIEMKIESVEKEPHGFDETLEENPQWVTSDDHDLHLHLEASGPNSLQLPHRRKSRTFKNQHLLIQRPIQILRPPHQSSPQSPQHTVGNKSTATRISPSTSSTSTLSGLARPFEPSATRQAQLQSTLQSSTSPSVRSDLNPTSTAFSPRLVYQQNGGKRTSWNPNASAGG